jgi:hypothetical protein
MVRHIPLPGSEITDSSTPIVGIGFFTEVRRQQHTVELLTGRGNSCPRGRSVLVCGSSGVCGMGGLVVWKRGMCQCDGTLILGEDHLSLKS